MSKNYDLVFYEGEAFPGSAIYSAVPEDDEGKTFKCEKGFGFTQIEAAKDFLNKNTTEVIEKVFDKK